MPLIPESALRKAGIVNERAPYVINNLEKLNATSTLDWSIPISGSAKVLALDSASHCSVNKSSII